MDAQRDNSTQTAEQQQRADTYFHQESAYWKAIYTDTDLMSTIYQLRRSVVLDMVDSLKLPKDAAILEVGCGAGLTSVEVARRGYTVEATDTVEAMLTLARRHAEEAGLAAKIHVTSGDIYHLGYADASFDLVIAMGVIPWLHSPHDALREMARVTRTGGLILFTADNKWRLNYVLDPRHTPFFNPLKRALKGLFGGGRGQSLRGGAQVYMYSVMEINAMVAGQHLRRMKGVTLGFGPFSFLNRILFRDPVGVRLHRVVQRWADRGIPGVRSTGSHYVVLTQK